MAAITQCFGFLLLLLSAVEILAAQRMLLSSVQTLTLHQGKFTTGRRSSPIPQLRCVDGTVACRNLPSAVQCYNKGSDGIDVQWKCEAQLAKNTQFDSLQIQCEGYEYPDDPYVLAGSCGLTYSLKPSGTKSHSHRRTSKTRSKTYVSESNSTSTAFWIILCAALLMFLIYKVCLAPAARQSATSHGSVPTAPPYDEPPPYSSHQNDQAPGYGFRPEYTGSHKYETQGGQDSNTSSGGGFWTGAAVGGLAGYLFGSSGSRTNNHYGSAYTYSDAYRDDCRPVYVEQSSSSSSDDSDDPVTRTGYASTRRR